MARVDNRRPTIDEAVRMIAAGLDMGVNFLDSCTALVESSVPGEALKRLKARDRVIVSIRVSHKMKGIKADKQKIYKWIEDRRLPEVQPEQHPFHTQSKHPHPSACYRNPSQ